MESKNLGYCKFCHQSMIVETVGEISQEERDNIASGLCMCPEAISDRRKKERKEKIQNFIDEHFDPDLQIIIEYAIEMTEKQDMTDFRIGLPDDRVVRIWLDKDLYIHIRIKKDSDEELKV